MARERLGVYLIRNKTSDFATRAKEEKKHKHKTNSALAALQVNARGRNPLETIHNSFRCTYFFINFARAKTLTFLNVKSTKFYGEPSRHSFTCMQHFIG